MCGLPGMVVQMTTVIVMAMQLVCGPFPLTLLPMTDKRLVTTSPAHPLWPPLLATARVDTRMLAWYVDFSNFPDYLP